MKRIVVHQYEEEVKNVTDLNCSTYIEFVDEYPTSFAGGGGGGDKNMSKLCQYY